MGIRGKGYWIRLGYIPPFYRLQVPSQPYASAGCVSPALASSIVIVGTSCTLFGWLPSPVTQATTAHRVNKSQTVKLTAWLETLC